MPVAVSYPGVYIEEIPSGVRTITGVATSITAFVGRAQRGPVSKPITITSYADFVRNFGGLWTGSTMGYAVRDFYGNGGKTAIIVRVIHNDAKKANIALGSLTIAAASEGLWGNKLRARVDHDVSEDVAYLLRTNDCRPFQSLRARYGDWGDRDLPQCHGSG